MTEPKYQCPECHWVGLQREMRADSIAGSGEVDEVWSSWICPHCEFWHHGLEAYIKLDS